jgi:DegV family protein with EDD domain
MSANAPSSNGTPIIITDSTCDLPPALYEQYGIQIVPLKILFGDESYRSGIDMNMDEFVERLERGDVHPTTSQPTVHEFLELYQSLADQKRPILSIHLSKGLSGTVNAALQASLQLPDQAITVWDTKTISGALGFHVLTAARAAQAGYTIAQIIPLLEQTFAGSRLLFTLDDLSFLVRGGRIGSVRYHVAQTLHIKPIITVSKEGDTQGTYISAGRVRSLEKAVGAFVDYAIKEIGEGKKIRALSLHGVGPTPELAAKINEQLQQHFDCVFLDRTYSTPILVVHVGPLALALGYAVGDWPVGEMD